MSLLSRDRELPGVRGKHQFVSTVGLLLFTVCLTLGSAAYLLFRLPALAVAGSLLGLYLLFAIKVADQWEKAAGPAPTVCREKRGLAGFRLTCTR